MSICDTWCGCLDKTKAAIMFTEKHIFTRFFSEFLERRLSVNDQFFHHIETSQWIYWLVSILWEHWSLKG